MVPTTIVTKIRNLTTESIQQQQQADPTVTSFHSFYFIYYYFKGSLYLAEGCWLLQGSPATKTALYAKMELPRVCCLVCVCVSRVFRVSMLVPLWWGPCSLLHARHSH